MAASDVQDTLNRALEETGLNQANVVHRPRLLSDNGLCYISGQLADYLEDEGMTHTRGVPYHPQTQGKIERWHESLKNLTPANVYAGRGQTILLEREKTKRRTVKLRRLQHTKQAA